MSANPIVLPPSNLPAKLLQMPFVDTQTGVLTQEWKKMLSAFLTALRVQNLLVGSHAQRATVPASGRPAGTLYYETDRSVYYIVRSSAWVYFSGIYSIIQASLPAGLGANDAGFLAYVNDFAHLLQWQGANWDWAPGENGSDYYIPFLTTPNGPGNPVGSGTGWHVCDGSANVPRLNSDGTYSLVTVPNSAGVWYRQ